MAHSRNEVAGHLAEEPEGVEGLCRPGLTDCLGHSLWRQLGQSAEEEPQLGDDIAMVTDAGEDVHA